MRADEFIEAFKKRGHPIGGNETKTAWNRLWAAKNNGVLINIPSRGYWLADEPIPEFDGLTKRRRSKWGEGVKEKWKGKPVGRVALITEAHAKKMKEMFAEGKTVKQIALEMGGISTATVYTHLKKLDQEPSAKGPKKKAR